MINHNQMKDGGKMKKNIFKLLMLIVMTLVLSTPAEATLVYDYVASTEVGYNYGERTNQLIMIDSAWDDGAVDWSEVEGYEIDGWTTDQGSHPYYNYMMMEDVSYYSHVFYDYDKYINGANTSNWMLYTEYSAPDPDNGSIDVVWQMLTYNIDSYDENIWQAPGIYGYGTWVIQEHTHEESPVPEPATMLLFGIGLLGIASVSRRKTT